MGCRFSLHSKLAIAGVSLVLRGLTKMSLLKQSGIRTGRVVIVLWLLACTNLLAVELIAHRGYTCRAVENTGAAVTDAWLARADGVELDLRISSDGVILVYHDEQLAGRPISGLSYDKIRSVADNAVPTFQSVLDLGQPQGYFLLDLKESNANGYRPLGKMISASGLDAGRFRFQSKSVGRINRSTRHNTGCGVLLSDAS